MKSYRVESGAKALLVERTALEAGVPTLADGLEIELAPGAELEHYVLLDGPAGRGYEGRLRVRQAQGSRFRSWSLLAGWDRARLDIDVTLEGPGADCFLGGLYLGRRAQDLGLTTRVSHVAGDARSEEFYQGILADHARASFAGRIHVAKQAAGTDSRQLNHNLLLSDDAWAETRPELEVYADQVQCAHGATCGRLDEEALFYLRSRGLSALEARRMLILAFAERVLGRIEHSTLREECSARTGAWLAEGWAS